jgi:1-acyl-sn-glycerol-3-phosphate acyltransferase
MAKPTADITGTARLVLALAAFAAATPPLMLWQAVALRAPFMDERRVPRLWHRMVVRLLGLRVRIHGAPARGRPLLIAANHVSWTDIMALGAVADVQFIAKTEVAGWPLFGRLAKLQRTVFIDRGRPRRSGEQAEEIAARLALGEPMVLFAEGTTSDGNTLLPFKSSLFAAAQMAMGAAGEAGENAAVQPVAIVYTRLHGMPMSRRERMRAAWIGDQTLVPHLASLLREGGIGVEIHFGEPVAFGADADRKTVAREVESRVRAMMAAARRQPS